MRLGSEISAELLWDTFINDWLSVHMTTVSCDGKSHSNAKRIGAFPVVYEEVIAAPRCCFVRGVGVSNSATTIPAPQLSVPAAAKPSVKMMNRVI